MAGDITNQQYWTSVINQSLCKFFILQALFEEPLHGYGIIKKVEEQTKGFCIPNEGTVYPILREFEDCGCAKCTTEVVNGRQRKIYKLTPKGRDAFRTGAKVWEKGLQHLSNVIKEAV